MVHVVDATAERWDDLVEVFGLRGAASRCFCQYFRFGGNYLARDVDTNRNALHDQLATTPTGVLALDAEGTPVGWCDVGPRASYPRLVRAEVAQATADEDGLWSVVCFVVRVGHRRQGVSTALLAGALDLARRRGARAIEAYPVDAAVKKASSADLYWGALALYERAGFAEVARPTPSRAVVRLAL